MLVVIFHISLAYNTSIPCSNFFKAFRMPLYFFLSGFFFKTYEGFIGFLKRKTNKLLIPFVFYYLILSVALSLILHNFWGITLERASNFELIPALTEFAVREEFPNSPIWFLLCLFEINLLFYCIYVIAEKYCAHKKVLAITLMSLLVGGVGLMLSHYHINLPAFIDSSFSALPFFCAGYIVNRHTKILYDNKYDKYTWVIVIVSFLLVLLAARYVDYKQNKISNISMLTAYPCGLLGTMGVLYIAKYIKKLPLISYWGRYSIMILVTHRMVYQLFEPLINLIGIAGWIAVITNFVITMLSYLLLIPFMKKYLPHVTAQKDLIKI